MRVWPESITVSRIEIEIKSKKVFFLFAAALCWASLSIFYLSQNRWRLAQLIRLDYSINGHGTFVDFI